MTQVCNLRAVRKEFPGQQITIYIKQDKESLQLGDSLSSCLLVQLSDLAI